MEIKSKIKNIVKKLTSAYYGSNEENREEDYRFGNANCIFIIFIFITKKHQIILIDPTTPYPPTNAQKCFSKNTGYKMV